MPDARTRHCLDRAAGIAPWLTAEHLIPLVNAVLDAADEYFQLQEEVAYAEHRAHRGAPTRTPVPLTEIVPGDAVWTSEDDGYFEFVDTAEHAGNRVTLGYPGGRYVTFDLGEVRTILRAADPHEALEWNFEHTAWTGLDDVSDDQLELFDIQHPDSDAGDRRAEPGEEAA